MNAPTKLHIAKLQEWAQPELLLTELPKYMDDKSFDFIDDLLPWSPRVQAECGSQIRSS